VQGAPVYCDGAAFKKGDEALRDAYDVELAKLKKLGESPRLSSHMALGGGGDVDDARQALRGEVGALFLLPLNGRGCHEVTDEGRRQVLPRWPRPSSVWWHLLPFMGKGAKTKRWKHQT